MKCPACSIEMVEKDFGGVMVDVCENGCKGIWFDWLELVKLDEKHEGVGAALQETLKHPRVNDENRGALNCPKCGIPMKEHKYKSSKEVNTDECYSCGGFFLDSGELNDIRDSFMTDEEQETYLNKLISGSPEHQEAKANQEVEKTRAAAARKFTRFMRLSYYSTGR